MARIIRATTIVEMIEAEAMTVAGEIAGHDQAMTVVEETAETTGGTAEVEVGAVDVEVAAEGLGRILETGEGDLHPTDDLLRGKEGREQISVTWHEILHHHQLVHHRPKDSKNLKHLRGRKGLRSGATMKVQHQ